MEENQIDPALEMIKIKMKEKKLRNKDLVPLIGTRGHVSSVLSGRKNLTLSTAKKLKDLLDLPADIFLK